MRNEDRKLLTLKDHNIPPESKLHLIIVMCAVPDELDSAVFDFYWGLPHGRSKDYLDVSVLVYSGSVNLGVIYYREPYLFDCPGVQHSGPADMYYGRREGRQRVNLNLKTVPQRVDKLVFTLGLQPIFRHILTTGLIFMMSTFLTSNCVAIKSMST